MKFLAFEGLDGSGKSSLMKQLVVELESRQVSYVQTREPGGTVVSDDIREIILRKASEHPVPKAELLLYQASRAQHVELVVKPALEKKHWVLCDRFTASSIAFQAGGRSISLQEVNWLNNFSTSGLTPDLNILLDLTVMESEKRRQQRQNDHGSKADRMESEKKDFHERVRKAFLDEATRNPGEWLVLDAAHSPEALFKELITELKGRKWLS